jgi:hypothetical protein
MGFLKQHTLLISLYFFESKEDDGLNCNLSLDEGVCDAAFNELGYKYDGDDCCAATCTKSNCGRQKGLKSIFGENVSVTNFPDRKDAKMEPITIHLNNITSSRHQWDLDLDWEADDLLESQCRAEEPTNAYFALDCDGKNSLTIYIDETMKNRNETVMVEDGANCSIELMTDGIDGFDDKQIRNAEPIWFVNFTISHTENWQIPILTHSSQEGDVNFKRIPQCYFRELENYTDIG